MAFQGRRVKVSSQTVQKVKATMMSPSTKKVTGLVLSSGGLNSLDGMRNGAPGKSERMNGNSAKDPADYRFGTPPRQGLFLRSGEGGAEVVLIADDGGQLLDDGDGDGRVLLDEEEQGILLDAEEGGVLRRPGAGRAALVPEQGHLAE